MYNRQRYLQRLGMSQPLPPQTQQPEPQSESLQSLSSSQTTAISTDSLAKDKIQFDELQKFFDKPIVIDNKEESTAEEDEEELQDKFNSISSDQNNGQQKHHNNHNKLHLHQSFIGKEGDFLINLYVQQEEDQKVRNKYINKLISNNVLRQEPAKKHQTMIIFDWDDTLFCTSYFYQQRFENITPEQQKHLNNLDISAIVTNLICLGDSHIEMDAAHVLGKEFQQSFIKTVKFKEQPRIEELIKQLDLVSDKLEQIYTNLKNLTIRLEKKCGSRSSNSNR